MILDSKSHRPNSKGIFRASVIFHPHKLFPLDLIVSCHLLQGLPTDNFAKDLPTKMPTYKPANKTNKRTDTPVVNLHV